MAMTMKLGALRMHELKVYVKNKMRKMIENKNCHCSYIIHTQQLGQQLHLICTP